MQKDARRPVSGGFRACCGHGPLWPSGLIQVAAQRDKQPTPSNGRMTWRGK